MLNSISVDVEEYFHATNLEPWIPPAHWHRMRSRLEHSMEKTLQLFSDSNTKGTFFILGSTARRFPHVIKQIAALGHEIASHGYGHRLAYEQTPQAFFRDVYRTKRLLENLTSTPVFGYRAPNFSITDRNLWAYDKLIDAGYRYDSSLYPISHPRYGNKNKSRTPLKIKRANGELLVFPLATTEITLNGFSFSIPLAGGAYWRHFPQRLLTWGLKRLTEVEHLPAHCYLHPWELDTDQPRVPGLPFYLQLRHYGGIPKMEGRVRFFLNEFSFVPLRESFKETTEKF